MIRLIKSELQKLFTIRSTYVILAFCLAISIFFAFYVEGLKLTQPVTDPGKLLSETTSALNALAFIISLAGVLLVTHEYRYNTIMYTLTSSASRLKVLLAKVIAVSIFAVLVSLFFGTLAPLLTYAGVHLKGLAMVHQSIPIADTLWRVALFGWGYAMLGLILAFIIRNQIGAIIVLLVGPSSVEGLLSLLLKQNTAYLPFNALGTVLGGSDQRGPAVGHISPEKAALVVAIYILVGFAVSAYLFKRRDAN
jgi:ABC-2 type transport system permease protein